MYIVTIRLVARVARRRGNPQVLFAQHPGHRLGYPYSRGQSFSFAGEARGHERWLGAGGQNPE